MNSSTRHGRGWMLLLAAVAMIWTQTVSAQQYWTGDGGKGIRLAVFEPVGKGLSADEQWVLSLIQGSITGDFNKFSAMTIIDRQNLDKIFAEWKESRSDNYSDADRIKIGNLTNASHILTGSINKTNNVFILELTVTDVASGERKASYSPTPVSLLAIENLSAIKTASADLLRQLGVGLTDAAKGELMQTVNTARLQAETMLARGIAAQKKGTDVEALSYFFQATALDASLVEASKLSSVLSANISSGNIGADVRNDILWRKDWIAKLKETEETFYKMINTADPPYTLYYSTIIKTGKVNYQTETVDLSVQMGLIGNMAWFNMMEQTLGAVLAVIDGLNTTNRKNDWGLANWPWNGVSNTNPFASSKKYDITVAIELVNQQGRVIGHQKINMTPNFRITSDNKKRLTGTYTEIGIDNNVNFKSVRADDISDNLTIRVASINGMPPESARIAIIVMDGKTQPLVDTRDGKRYNTVKIIGKTWMAENLNYQPKTGQSWCYLYYDISSKSFHESSNCNKYGRLYDWNTALSICPIGWHLPSKEDWAYLYKWAGKNMAGKNLKAKSDWNNNGNGTDNYGFSALPGGSRSMRGFFIDLGTIGRWWTATESDGSSAYDIFVGYDNTFGMNNSNKGLGLSVRCVQND